MSSDEQTMPIRPETHATGDTGIAAFQYCVNLLKWTFEPVGKDYGLDGKVEVFQDGKAIGYMFFVQSKSTEKSINSRKYIAEYFKLPKRNYFLNINTPILIILHSTRDQETLFRWAFSEDDFEETEEGYKFVFNKSYTLNPKSLDDFSKSVVIANHLYHVSRSQILPIHFTGNTSKIIKAQSLSRNVLPDFYIEVVNDQNSPIIINITDDEITCILPGFLTYTEKYRNLEISLFSLLEIIFSKLHTKYKKNFKILSLLSDFSPLNFNITAELPEFVIGLNYGNILRQIYSRMLEENSTVIAKIVFYLQLHFFELDENAKNTLIDIRQKIYENSNEADDYLNYLIILQANGSRERVKLLLERYDILNESLIYSDRFLMEYANAASKCQLPALALNALSRMTSLNDVESSFLLIKAHIYAGQYQQAHLLAQSAVKMENISSAFISLSTYLRFITQILCVKDQNINIVNRPEDVGIRTTQEALNYITEVDATHPQAWLILAHKEPNELIYLDEPEFYATFGAMLGHGRLLFRTSFLLLIEKIYQDSPNRDILSMILVNLLEEALVIRGRNFIDYLFDEFTDIYGNDDILADILKNFENIETFHNERRKFFKNSGDGFIGNDFFIPSILRQPKN